MDEALRRMSVSSSSSAEQAVEVVRLHIRKGIRVQQLAAAMINEAVHAPKGIRMLPQNKLRKKFKKLYKKGGTGIIGTLIAARSNRRGRDR